jgi:protein-disulfide isomerase
MHDHVRGNPSASVRLVEYADFECPYCGMAEPYAHQVVERFHDEIALVFRPFPLVEIHPHAMQAAQAAEAASLQRKFWEMHDLLFANQKRLDEASLLQYAQSIGLDLDRFRQDFASRGVLDAISESVARGKEQGVAGTPTFFLNGQLLEIHSYEDLNPLVARSVARFATAKGRTL